MHTFILIALVFIFNIPVLAHAGPIIRSGDTISIDSSQILQGDFYGLGSTVSISGSAEDDVYIAGGTVTINAPVSGDVAVLGGVVQVHGKVSDDLRVVGGEVVIAEEVQGDVVVLGGTLTILSTAKVHGDVLFFGGDIRIEGDVVGTIHGTSDTARIDSEIGGDVSYVAQHSLVLGNKANIKGKITYDSPSDLVRAQDAQVSGDINKKNTPVINDLSLVKWYVLQGCVLLFVALSFYLLGSRYLQAVTLHAFHSVGISGLLGLALFIIVPFISGVLMVSIVGSLMGILLLLVYIVTLIAAFICTGILFGYSFQRVVLKKHTLTFATVFLGVILLLLIGLIPVVGGLLVFAGMLVMFGALSRAFYQKLRGA